MKQIKILFFMLLFVGVSGNTWANANCKAEESDQHKKALATTMTLAVDSKITISQPDH